MCTEAEKNEHGFSQGGSVNFAGQCHYFSDALLGQTTPTKETIDHEFSTYSKIYCPLIGIGPMPIYLDLKKNFSYGTGSLGSACIVFENSCNPSKLMNL